MDCLKTPFHPEPPCLTQPSRLSHHVTALGSETVGGRGREGQGGGGRGGRGKVVEEEGMWRREGEGGGWK